MITTFQESLQLVETESIGFFQGPELNAIWQPTDKQTGSQLAVREAPDLSTKVTLNGKY